MLRFLGMMILGPVVGVIVDNALGIKFPNDLAYLIHTTTYLIWGGLLHAYMPRK